MDKLKISVIMPVCNSEKYLKESIDSVLNQSFKDFELIIVNDCSTDNSLNIINNYDDKRIKLFSNQKNLGTVKSRNIGLNLSLGEYIAVMDSDDVSLQSRLEKQFNYLESNKHIFLAGSSVIFIDDKGKEISRFRKYNDYKMLAWRLPKSCGIVHSSVMFRNTKKYFYNESFISAHDYDFYLNLLSKGENLTNLPDFLVKHRVHKDSGHNSTERQIMFRDLTQELHDDLRNKFNFFEKVSFSFKLLIHYLKTYREKRGL